MATERYTPPVIDFSDTTSDLHRRFLLFKQKVELIFAGPLADKDEDLKARMLLLWIGDKGLEIFNNADFETDADKLKTEKILKKLEDYTKPTSNQILCRYKLRCLKQGDMPVEEFVTQAKSLIKDSGYSEQFKEEMLRDTMIFGITSEQVRKDAISKGNQLTFQQVYELAKTEETTKQHLKYMASGSEELNPDLHSLTRSNDERNGNQRGTGKPGPRQGNYNQNPPRQGNYNSNPPRQGNYNSNPPRQGNYSSNSGAQQQNNTSGCLRCGKQHSREKICAAVNARCDYCGKIGHYAKVCLKRTNRNVHDIQGRQIEDEDISFENYSSTMYMIQCTPIEEIKQVAQEPRTHGSTIFAKVTLNNTTTAKLKVDTGAGANVMTLQHVKALPFPVKFEPSNVVLTAYGGTKLKDCGVLTLQVRFRNNCIPVKFNIVDAPDSPSILGCQQSQDLGIIAVVNAITNNQPAVTPTMKNKKQLVIPGQLTEKTVSELYDDCFDRVGKFDTAYHIQLIDDPTPVVHPPRTVPVHIMPLYEIELKNMLRDGIISPAPGPTDWVNSIVCNIKTLANGEKKVRLCLDPKDLNKNIKREHYYSRKLDELLPNLHGKKIFSVVDTKKGYWHVPLDESSSELCTFNTPFGRYKFNRLPFGIKLSHDVFQKRLDDIYKGIPNVHPIEDDILIVGADQEEHDRAFLAMMEATRSGNVGLNKGKMQFKRNQVKFYGHLVTDNGLQAANDKLEGLKKLKHPTCKDELNHALGMLTYLGRFTPNLSTLAAPLRELLKRNVSFHWDERHEKAWDLIKNELLSARIVSYYDPNPATKTILQCDASLTGLGAWIRQVNENGSERIVAMASRSLSPAETRYSNIERECLAIQFGLERFEYYLLGRAVVVETDHAPLEHIFKKNINSAPGRLQRILLACLKYDITVRYVRGATIPLADGLSRVCPDLVPRKDPEIHFLTSSESNLVNVDKVRQAQNEDSTMRTLKEFVYKGWPSFRKHCPVEIQEFWNFRSDLTLEDGLIMKGERILIPENLRKPILQSIHLGHQGESKCKLYARQSVFWPRMNQDIEQMVKECEICNKYQSANAKLPMTQPDLPSRPWERIGTDIFEFKGQKFLIVADYYSRFFITRKLNNMTADTVSNEFIKIFSEYGLPVTITADFGSQYTSAYFRKCCANSGITLTFSSPYHHQTNSIAERSVGTCKKLWKKADEQGTSRDTAVWMYRTTPLDSHLPSPYELLFGRKPANLLPSSDKSLKSKHPETDDHLIRNQDRQDDQKNGYDKRAGNAQRMYEPGDPVYIFNTLGKIWEPGSDKTFQSGQRTRKIRREKRRKHISQKPRTPEVQKL